MVSELKLMFPDLLIEREAIVCVSNPELNLPRH